MKLIIDRSIWTRGKGNYKVAQEIQFGNKFDAFMFFGFELGYTKNDFLIWPESLTPLHVAIKTKKNLWPKELVNNNLNTKLCEKIMKINDSDKIDDTKREILLKEKFQELNVSVEFIGEQEIFENKMEEKEYNQIISFSKERYNNDKKINANIKFFLPEILEEATNILYSDLNFEEISKQFAEKFNIKLIFK